MSALIKYNTINHSHFDQAPANTTVLLEWIIDLVDIDAKDKVLQDIARYHLSTSYAA